MDTTAHIKEKYITISGNKYKFEYEWGTLEENIAKQGYLQKDKNLFIVILNRQYKILDVVEPGIFYHAIYITEGIMEALLLENEEDNNRVISLRDEVMKNLAKCLSEEDIESQLDKDTEIYNIQHYLLSNDDNSVLNDREKEILILRMEKKWKLEDIATKFKISRGRVQQIINNSKKKINNTDAVGTIEKS